LGGCDRGSHEGAILMFGKDQAESLNDASLKDALLKYNGATAQNLITVLAAGVRLQPLTNAELSAKQEWLQGVVTAWTVGRSI
jgi:hypothetical protein